MSWGVTAVGGVALIILGFLPARLARGTLAHALRRVRFDGRLVVLSYFNAGVRAVDIRDPFDPVEVGYFVPETTENTTELCVEVDGTEICDAAIQTNNVNIDDRGYIYAVDRSSTGLHILELTGDARDIVGLE